MKRACRALRGCALVLAALVSGCAGPGEVDATGPLMREGHAVPEPGTFNPTRARELYDEARAAMHANRFVEALEMLAWARDQDPDSALIKDLFNEVSRIMSRRPGEWSPGGTAWSGTGISASLIRKRGGLERSMARVETLAVRRSWDEAATELSDAAELARGVLAEIVRLPECALGDRWIEEGTREMQRGEFGAAALCFEIALEGSGRAGSANSSLRSEAVAARLRECRELALPVPPRAHSRRADGLAGLPPRSCRERMSVSLLTVIRYRLLLGERDAAFRESAFLASIDPDSEAALTLNRKLPCLPVWNPWESVDSGLRRLQQEFTDVTNLLRSAQSLELRGEFAAAAEHFERAAKNMHWFPFDTEIHPWNLDAESGAARCRRLAEDASR